MRYLLDLIVNHVKRYGCGYFPLNIDYVNDNLKLKDGDLCGLYFFQQVVCNRDR